MSLSRRQFLVSGAAVGLSVGLVRNSRGGMANDALNLGFISCGDRANEHLKKFSEIPGVNISGLCDPDESRLGLAGEKYPQAKKWKDVRELIDDRSIDAVVVTTTNHWHCLAAIWAMQASKDVYVEKPLSHSQWEGRQTVSAARKFNRICQIGTQQRSDPMQAEIKKFLHVDKALGPIQSVRVNRFGVRAPIGKRTASLAIDPSIDYNLWLGPAQDQAIFREKLHYDWHWDWNTGSGEMGNWGVHILDDVRNNVFQDQVLLPNRIGGGGGRIAWNDAGVTPNFHFVYFDANSIPVVLALSNLPGTPDGKKSPTCFGPDSGYVVFCQGGRLEGQRLKAEAFDETGKSICKFNGDGGAGHQQNFLDAVRSRDQGILNAEVEIGHYSTGWCNLANIAFRCGRQADSGSLKNLPGPNDLWNVVIDEMKAHAGSYGLNLTDPSIQVSPLLEIDVTNERFTGDAAEQANQFLKREYRKPFEVPEIAQR